MVDPLTISTAATLGLGALKTGFGFFQAGKQRDEERATLREQLRRMRLENEKILGGATAVGASDEFGLSGSLPAYIQKMGAEMSRQLDWTRRAGQAASSMNYAANLFGTATDFGGSLIRAGDANRWWVK